MAGQQPIVFTSGDYAGQKVKEAHFGPIITTETIFPDGLSSQWHYHSNPHFSHILSGGSKEIRKNGSQQQAAGTGLYYYPGVPHQNMDYRAGTRIFNIELEPAFFEQYELPVPCASFMEKESMELNTGGLMKLLKEHYRQDADTLIAMDQLCIQLLQTGQPTEKYFPEWAQKIRTALQDQWNDPLTLLQLAEQLQLHPVTISKHFSKYFRCNLGEYRRRLKVERALSLIRSTPLSLTEIAYSCGFADQAHFTKTFQQVTGLLPKHYRQL